MSNPQGTKTAYDAAFYSAISGGSARSASACVPLFMELFSPASVLDIGCGQGTWLAEFVRLGVTDVFGVDGDYVDQAHLKIPAHAFQAHDLTAALSLTRRFDLALCLEVAEHLPPAVAETLVAELTTAAPIVVFSAAVPGQGGVDHINEQWPRYWRDRFERHGMVCLDVIRPRIWQCPAVEPYYQQNIFVFVNPVSHGALLERHASARDMSLTLVQSYIVDKPDAARPSLLARLRRKIFKR